MAISQSSRSSASPRLLDDAFDPITYSIAFFNASLNAVADEISTWRAELYGTDAVVRTELDDIDLPDMLHELEPIVRGATGRELLVATANAGWTAYFAGRFAGVDEGPVSNIARRMECRAVMAHSVLPSDPEDLRRPNGGVSFLLVADHKTDWLNYERSVGVGQDGKRWRFEQSGTPQNFETPDAYGRRVVRERFTHEMLVGYCSAMGLYPYDPAFYSKSGVLIESREPHEPLLQMSLSEARRYLNIDQ